jgi:molecular chaperone DnaJ
MISPISSEISLALAVWDAAGGRAMLPAAAPTCSIRVDLTFEEAVFGVDKEIEITRNETCVECSGSGAEPGTSPSRCQTCNGQGEVRQVRQTILGSMVQVATCPTCGGAGETVTTPCRNCQGRGQERHIRKKTITIPAGVDNGNQMRLPGEGEPGANGGPNGNLYLAIHVARTSSSAAVNLISCWT